MRPSSLALGAFVLLAACYPGYVGLGLKNVGGAGAPDNYATVQQNLDNCHKHLDDVAHNAYDDRRHQFYFTDFISSVTLLGGGASTFFGDKTVKTVGGVASLITGVTGILKGKDGTDLENTQARDSKAKGLWEGVLTDVANWEVAWQKAKGNAGDPVYQQAALDLSTKINSCIIATF